MTLFCWRGDSNEKAGMTGAEHFKELQTMKFVWRNNIGDLVAWNSAQVEEVNKMKEYEDFLKGDKEQCDWDLAEDEISEVI